jgi:hypothetical protein
LVVEIDPLNVIEFEEGHDFSLAAKKLIEQIFLFGTEEEKSKDTIEISVKYSVLSEKTAFFGKIKNKFKSGQEINKIYIPVKKLDERKLPRKFHGMGGPGIKVK